MTTATNTRQQDLDKITAEAAELQKKYEGKKWDPKDRAKFEGLCREGQEMQKDVEAENEWKRMQENGRRLAAVPDPALPHAGAHYQEKANGDRAIAGYVSLGDLVIASDAFRDWAGEGYPRGKHAVINLTAAMLGKSVRRGPSGETLVPLTKSMREMYGKFLETKEAKAVPTLGAGVLEPERVERVPQVTADERLRMRDVIAGGSISSSGVEYVREELVTGEAAETAPGQIKPEIAIEYSLQAAPVRDIPAWMPVLNQQLADWAMLRSLIDARLRYKVQRREEEQLIFGNGTPPNIEGIAVVAGTNDIATNGRFNPATHTLIDAVRMGITDVRISGGEYEPNVVVIHPVDWETILLEKGSDERYVWAVVTDANGSRIWGVSVVEATACQHRTTNRRVFVVGDFRLGAQLLDRMQLTVQVGLIDKQFIENKQTILAESRIAFPIYAPAAFALFETQAGS